MVYIFSKIHQEMIDFVKKEKTERLLQMYIRNNLTFHDNNPYIAFWLIIML